MNRGPRAFRLAPGGSRLDLAGLWRLDARGGAQAVLQAGIEALLGPGRLALHVSGRDALRAGFAALARRSGRGEVVLPGYTCWSVPAAAVAAGLRVRLVDVDADGRLDARDLARLPLERAAAVLVSNLYGVPEDVGRVRELARAAGAAVVDDAAQSLGARDAEGAVGARGDLGLLSFARGKPLSGLGGGALFWPGEEGPVEGDPAPRAAPWRATLRALAWNAALSPRLFGWLAGLPGLGIGETEYDPGFARGPIDGACLALTAASVGGVLDQAATRRARAESLAERLGAADGWRPRVAGPGAAGVYPRLALVAPDPERRAHALERLAPWGATASYPDSLDRLPALQAERAEPRPLPGARRLAERVLTLPWFADVYADPILDQLAAVDAG